MQMSPPSELFGMDGMIILVVVAVVLFGSTQIPRLARSLGSARREFKEGLAAVPDDDSPAPAVSSLRRP